VTSVQRISRRLRGLLVAGICIALTTLGQAAYAVPAPPNDGPAAQPAPPIPPATPVRVVEIGSPAWQFLVVAVSAAVIAIVVEHLVSHWPDTVRAVSHPA
jgi:hypothetical protein